MAKKDSHSTALMIVAIVAIVAIVGFMSGGKITGAATNLTNITEYIQVNCTTWIGAPDSTIDALSGYVQQDYDNATVYTDNTTNVNWGGPSQIADWVRIENRGNNEIELNITLTADPGGFLGVLGNSLSVRAENTNVSLYFSDDTTRSCKPADLLSSWTPLTVGGEVTLCNNFSWQAGNDELVFFDRFIIQSNTPPGTYNFTKKVSAVEVSCGATYAGNDTQTYHFVSDAAGNAYEWVDIKSSSVVDDTWTFNAVSSGAINVAKDIAFRSGLADGFPGYELWAIDSANTANIHRFDADTVVGAVYENTLPYTLGLGPCVVWDPSETLEAIAWGDDGNLYIASYETTTPSAWVRAFSYAAGAFTCTANYSMQAINGYGWPIDGLAPRSISSIWVYEFQAPGVGAGIGEIKFMQFGTGTTTFQTSPLVATWGLAEDYTNPQENVLWGANNTVSGSHASVSHLIAPNAPVAYGPFSVFGANTPQGATSSTLA